MKFLRICFLVLTLLSGYTDALSQQHVLDSLKKRFATESNDTLRLVHAASIARIYKEINPDSTYRYADSMLTMAVKLRLRLEESVALGELGYALLNQGNYPRSLQALLQAIAIAEHPATEEHVLPASIPPYDEYVDRKVSARLQRLAVASKVIQYTAILYNNTLNYKKALSYTRSAVPLALESTNLPILIINYITLGRTYMQLNQQDSALYSFQNAYDYSIRSNDKRYLGSILLNTGRVYLNLKKPEMAKSFFKRALIESQANEYFRGAAASDLELAELFRASGKSDSSQYHIRHALRVANYLKAPDLSLRCYTALVDIYKKSNIDSTVKYQALIIQINKETFNAKQVQQFQNIDYSEQQRLAEIATARKEYQVKLRTNFLLGSTFTLLVIAFFLYRNSRTRQKAKQRVEEAYEQLKKTQSQLIQSEKMASLGELTAGIAHEIQNPLNFINNFAEVNAEMITELNEAVQRGDLNEAKSIAATLAENESKVVAHGKRADAIVKGMLQHSRTSSGKKEPTDINALCDEYLRLAYHGLRAKDKSFNAKFETNLDPALPAINVVSQEIGRVVLNLINNAFYAANERKKKETSNFEPVVMLTTRKEASQLIIEVADNGNGIPNHIKDKIFQPFFTTKPTGQGTGLGLSLSYDIVKTHGGELQAETKEGKGTTFSIRLPLS